MKMVILGAQAPKCETKPQNPTSTSRVGTMTGHAASGLRATNKGGKKDAVMHRQQYQGLLQAPKIMSEYLALTEHTDGPES